MKSTLIIVNTFFLGGGDFCTQKTESGIDIFCFVQEVPG